MQPLVFEPIIKQSRWGGTQLGKVLGKKIGQAGDYSESWEISDHGRDQSLVLGGELAGWTLRRLVEERAVELLGPTANFDKFPLLIKFLDACDLLSVQVHPNDEQAVRFDPTELGKTEAWVILAAEDGAELFAGLKSHVDADVLRKCLAEGTVEDCLHRFPARAGDCIFIPAGTVHAIGSGILLAEVQQSSDLTFRLDDWGRMGTDGKPRPLHLEEAFSCIDFTRGPVNPITPCPLAESIGPGEELVHADNFVLRRFSSATSWQMAPDGRFHVLMTLNGHGQLQCDAVQIALSPGQSVLVPASAGPVSLLPDGPQPLTILETHVLQ